MAKIRWTYAMGQAFKFVGNITLPCPNVGGIVRINNKNHKFSRHQGADIVSRNGDNVDASIASPTAR